MDDSSHELLTYFADAEQQMLKVVRNFDEIVASVDSWHTDMFAIFDQSFDMVSHLLSMANRENNLYAFVPMTIPELHIIC